VVRFESLAVENFFSYGEAAIQFKPGLVLLEGRNLDRGGCSNMAGKSALWDTLATVLWEENSRGQVKDDIVNRVKKSGQASVVFEREGLGRVEVEYVRGVDKRWVARVNGKVEAYNWDMMRKRVRELVGMSYEEFTLSSWFQQGMMDSFLVKPDAERKELFVKWLGLDVFQKMREKVKERRKEVEAELRIKRDMLELLEKLKELEIKEEELKSALEVLEKWKGVIPVSLEEYRKKRSSVLEQLKKFRDAKRVEGLVLELRRVRDECAGKVASIKERMKYLRDGRCWVCGSEVDTDKMLEEASKEFVTLSETLKKAETQLKGLEEIYIKGRGVDRERLLTEMIEVRRRVGDVDEYRKAIELKAKAEEQKKQKQMLEQIDFSMIEELQWELETARKWERGLGDDGVVAYVLERALVMFNELMRKYGELLGIDVSFKIGNRGQLEVEVSDGFKSMSRLNWWSGSERYAIMLVVMLGLSEFLSYQGKGTNLLILDEVFAPFDRIWRERLVELLRWFQGGDKTVIVITHHEDVKKMVDWDEVWLVEKRDGISCLRVE